MRKQCCGALSARLGSWWLTSLACISVCLKPSCIYMPWMQASLECVCTWTCNPVSSCSSLASLFVCSYSTLLVRRQLSNYNKREVFNLLPINGCVCASVQNHTAKYAAFNCLPACLRDLIPPTHGSLMSIRVLSTVTSVLLYIGGITQCSYRWYYSVLYVLCVCCKQQSVH